MHLYSQYTMPSSFAKGKKPKKNIYALNYQGAVERLSAAIQSRFQASCGGAECWWRATSTEQSVDKPRQRSISELGAYLLHDAVTRG